VRGERSVYCANFTIIVLNTSVFLSVSRMVCNCSPFRALEAKVIGGVTLNHLSWAALGGGMCVCRELYLFLVVASNGIQTHPYVIIFFLLSIVFNSAHWVTGSARQG
jgi:hypothetical protein